MTFGQFIPQHLQRTIRATSFNRSTDRPGRHWHGSRHLPPSAKSGEKTPGVGENATRVQEGRRSPELPSPPPSDTGQLLPHVPRPGAVAAKPSARSQRARGHVSLHEACQRVGSRPSRFCSSPPALCSVRPPNPASSPSLLDPLSRDTGALKATACGQGSSPQAHRRAPPNTRSRGRRPEGPGGKEPWVWSPSPSERDVTPGRLDPFHSHPAQQCICTGLRHGRSAGLITVTSSQPGGC